MAVILIAACAGAKRVIGDKGDMPWHFSSDLKFFKATTRGHAVLMGRTTFEAVLRYNGRPLPDRRHLVLSHNRQYRPAAGEVFHDIAAALAAVPAGQDVYVIGGQQIFEQALPLADRVLLTHIEKDYAGDAFFPPLDPALWELVEERPVTEQGTLLRFCVYRRKQ